MRKRERQPKEYATLRQTFSEQALLALGFRREGSAYVKRGACRMLLAEATSLNNLSWRVKPYARCWR